MNTCQTCGEEISNGWAKRWPTKRTCHKCEPDVPLAHEASVQESHLTQFDFNKQGNPCIRFKRSL